MYDLGQDKEVVDLSFDYYNVMLLSLLPFMLFLAFKQFLEGLKLTKPGMVVSVIANIVNVILNYILIFGKFGSPAFGVAGAAWATFIARLLMFILIVFFIYKSEKLKKYLFSINLLKIKFKKIKEITKIGVPIGLQYAMEVSAFSVGSIIVGTISAEALAAHQIAMQCATFAFMFPLGIAQGTAIRVGQSIGEGSLLKAKYAGYVGVSLGIIIAVITAVICLSFPTILIGLFINVDEPNHAILISSAVKFLGVMALFQILDAVQVIMNGALRGLKDTFVPMCLGLLSYWISGLTSGYLLAFVYGLGGVGLWWGLGIGIGISGMLLVFRFKQRVLREESILALASPVSA